MFNKCFIKNDPKRFGPKKQEEASCPTGKRLREPRSFKRRPEACRAAETPLAV